MVDGDIDGVGGVLGFAGIVFMRVDNDLPVITASKIDSADIPGGLASGDFASIIRHEFGHAMGAVHTNRRDECPSDNFDDSPIANQRFQDLSGCDFLAPTNGNGGDTSGCVQ